MARINRSEFLAHAEMRAAARTPAVRFLYVSQTMRQRKRERMARVLHFLIVPAITVALFVAITN